MRSVVSAPVSDVISLAHGIWPRADIVNGERNTIYLSIENKEGERNVTLKNIAGSLHYVQNNKVVKNVRRLYCHLLQVFTARCSSPRWTTVSPCLTVLPCSFLTRSTASMLV